ncbi:ABC transporter permease [Paenibacillus apiarius]|uniref:ABC transporter permease n=1 Tax=Paenibacillus apiarius TaxID=46240 RepID=UPI00197F0119|nr:ABC transporter permease [Paenibacillus apiarius]MBN3524504.1 ABC transporter permease [Paenibacillus apiarius]
MFTLRRKDIIFTLLFLCLYIICYLFLTYIDKQERFNELSNGFYSNHHAVLINNGDNDWVETELSQSSYRLFIEYNDTYRFFIDHSSDWSPPIESGRFFSHEEKKPVAVIGREMLEYSKDSNGGKHISFNGESYEVIGIMGASFASPVDYLILLYQPGQTPLTPDMRIIIDSDHKSTVTEITENLIKKFPMITLIESAQKGLSRTANIPFLYRLLIFEFYLLLFLSALAFIRYWYESEKKKLYILFIMGISKNKINQQLFFKVSMYITVPGVMMCLFISIFDSGSFLKQLIGIAILFLISACSLLSLFLRTNSSSKGGAISK